MIGHWRIHALPATTLASGAAMAVALLLRDVVRPEGSAP